MLTVLHPMTSLSRDGSHALDHQLRDLPSVGQEHRERLRRWSQLDLQHPSVSYLPAPGSVLHLLWSVVWDADFRASSYYELLIVVPDRDKAGVLRHNLNSFLGVCPVKLIWVILIRLLGAVIPILMQPPFRCCVHVFLTSCPDHRSGNC